MPSRHSLACTRCASHAREALRVRWRVCQSMRACILSCLACGAARSRGVDLGGKWSSQHGAVLEASGLTKQTQSTSQTAFLVVAVACMRSLQAACQDCPHGRWSGALAASSFSDCQLCPAGRPEMLGRSSFSSRGNAVSSFAGGAIHGAAPIAPSVPFVRQERCLSAECRS